MHDSKELAGTMVVIAMLVAAPNDARAFVKQFTLAEISPGTIMIDGSADDWYDAQYPCIDLDGNEIVWGGSRWNDEDDYSLTACFAQDDKNIYIALDVSDDRQVRTKKPTPDEDHVELWIDHGEDMKRTVIHFYPERKFPTFHPALRRIDGTKSKPIKGAKFSMESHHDGWIAEIVLPLTGFPGLRDHLVASRWALVGVDSDTKGEDPKRQTILATRGVADADSFDEDSVHTLLVSMEKVQGMLNVFLDDQGLGEPSVKLMYADVAEDSRQEVLVKALPIIGILGSGFMSGASYTYVKLPVSGSPDVHALDVRDVTGNGKEDIVVRYTEKNSLGQRTVVAIYSFLASEIRKVLVQELSVSNGSKSIACDATFVPDGPNGSEMLLVTKGTASGWSEISYKNVPEYGVGAVLTPWDSEERRLWVVDGLDYKPVPEEEIDGHLEPKTKPKKKKKKKKK